jgi:hypothetical protein
MSTKPPGMWQSFYNAGQQGKDPFGVSAAGNTTGTKPTAAKPAPASPMSQVFDLGYETSKANLGASLGLSLANDTYAEGSAATQYGYKLSRDNYGNVNGWQADPTNPFSQMAALQHAYQSSVSQENAGYGYQRTTADHNYGVQQNSDINGFASMGQGSSGALAAQQGESKWQYENLKNYQDAQHSTALSEASYQNDYQQHQLAAQFQDAIHGFGADKLNAYNDYTAGISQAALQKLLNMLGGQ